MERPQVNSEHQSFNLWKTQALTPNSRLLTHLYEYFGTLIGCSEQGKPGFSIYDGEKSQASVHKYYSCLSHSNRMTLNRVPGI